jgi:hypothetical protein
MNAPITQLESPTRLDADDGLHGAERADYVQRLVAARCQELSERDLAEANLLLTVGASAMSHMASHVADAESLNLDSPDAESSNLNSTEAAGEFGGDGVPVEVLRAMLALAEYLAARMARIEAMVTERDI